MNFRKSSFLIFLVIFIKMILCFGSSSNPEKGTEACDERCKEYRKKGKELKEVDEGKEKGKGKGLEKKPVK